MKSNTLLERAGYAISTVAPAVAEPCAEAPQDAQATEKAAKTILPFGLRLRWGSAELLAMLIILFAIAAPAAAFFSRTDSPEPVSASWSDPAMGEAERPESNFPGSAFYFLKEEQGLNSNSSESGDDSDVANDDGTPFGVADALSGPAATALRITEGSADYSRALKCLTDAVYYEAALEPEDGQRAVAQVILNRVRHPSYPNTVCGVIYQGSERVTGCQFSYSCDGSMARTPSPLYWNRAQRIAKSALAGSVYAPVGHATHYHTTEINPYWAPSLKFLRTVGAHRFYSFKGSAGRPSAFFRKYAGKEPLPQPHARRAVAEKNTTDTLDPTKLQAEFAAKYAAAQAEAEKQAEADTRKRAALKERARLNNEATPAPLGLAALSQPTEHAAPDYSNRAAAAGGDAAFKASRLPQGSGIKAEYGKSGSWKF